ncbi:hypothetical protein CYANOKiyG1_19520 [Okeania sp. KiyG1]|nr:hypothetical protein CYANOKiyG1_19520 [Okeania sp. KiyG1]
MLKVTKQNSEDGEAFFKVDEIEKFPCQDLVRINQLWQESYQKKFGFSVQKSKYEETGNVIGEYKENTFNEFGKTVGWQQEGIWISDQELNFSSEALPGHLPSSAILRDTLRKGELFSRMNACSRNR